MKKHMIIQNSSLAEWHTLVNEAQQLDNSTLEEAVESYLVFLLMRFTQDPDLVTSILAIEFLEGVQMRQQQPLRDVADRCLLLSGLFPEQAARRLVSVDYFVGLGQRAYMQLADLPDIIQLGPYEDLCQEFMTLTRILRRMREIHQEKLLAHLQGVRDQSAGFPPWLH
ncbi:MAG: hypothetical protein DHS20C10_14010 [marine bacterium B5-7]|nr:MAG: hypothetical protein DHS20C10_14010 [marine bacterium B5-7]